ncbi:MAG: MGMT family protein [Dethiobacter sp.]|jgi:alkylated DNA nucleotide flippase Atl1|nr:MGMT family protein [Dethiobacter sp.]
MPQNIGLLLVRLKKRYTRLPKTAGVFFTPGKEGQGALARTGDRMLTTAAFSNHQDFINILLTSVRPHAICVCLDENIEAQQSKSLNFLRSEYDTVIYTSLDRVLPALGLTGACIELAEWFRANNLEIKRKSGDGALGAALAAITGYFYLADEFEYDAQSESIIPLLYESNHLYTFMRMVPYGEVVTFAEVAKALGLQWSEDRVMSELARLPAESEVFGHRLVHRDGRLSDVFPGGIAIQKEMLKWELVPFVDGEHVDLKRAQWTRQKYRPLTNYLKHAGANKKFVELNFTGIEKIIAVSLPRAARRLGSWWQDDKPHAWIWQSANRRVANINMQTQTVVFSSAN